MSLGVVEVDVAAAAKAELLNNESGNSALHGEQSAADLRGRTNVEEKQLVDCFLVRTPDFKRSAILCDREEPTALRNIAASNSAITQETGFTEYRCGIQGELKDDFKNTIDSPACDSCPASVFKGDRDDDGDFRLGNVHATVRSDLLITHGASDKGDTLYLIKREEMKETDDFWLKVDRAKHKAQPLSVITRRTEDFNVERAEKGAHEGVRTRGDGKNDTQPSTSLGHIQAVSWRHSPEATEQASAPNRYQSPDVRARTTESNNDNLPEEEAPSGKQQSLSEGRNKMDPSDSPVRCLDESLPKRALQLLRGVVRRKNRQGYYYDVRASVKHEAQTRSQKSEERLLNPEEKNADPSEEADATVPGAVDTSSDLRVEDDSSFSVISTPTKSELHKQLGAHQLEIIEEGLGEEEEEEEASISLHISSLIPEEVASEELHGTSTAGPPSTTKTKKVIRQKTRSPPPLGGLTACGGGCEVQADYPSTDLLTKPSAVEATGEWKAVQEVPQVVVTAADNDQAPAKLLWNAVVQPLQMQGIKTHMLQGNKKHLLQGIKMHVLQGNKKHVLEMPPASSMAAVQSQMTTESEVTQKHEHTDEEEDREKNWEDAISLEEGRLQGQEEETNLLEKEKMKEPKEQCARLRDRVERGKVELQGTSRQLSCVCEEALLFGIKQERRSSYLSSTHLLPLQPEQDDENEEPVRFRESAADFSLQGGTVVVVDKEDISEEGTSSTNAVCVQEREKYAEADRLAGASGQKKREEEEEEEEESKRERQNMRGFSSRKETPESLCLGYYPQADMVKSDDGKQRYSLDLPSPEGREGGGQLLTRGSDDYYCYYTNIDVVHGSRRKKMDDRDGMDDFMARGSSSSSSSSSSTGSRSSSISSPLPCPPRLRRVSEMFDSIRGTIMTPVNIIERDDGNNTLKKVPAQTTPTVEKKVTSIVVSPRRVPMQTTDNGDKHCFLLSAGKEVKCSTKDSQAAGGSDSPGEFAGLNPTIIRGNACELEGRAVHNALKKQQANETWPVFKNREQACLLKQFSAAAWPFKANTREDMRPGDTRSYGNMASSSLRYTNAMPKSRRSKSGTTEERKKLQVVTLQRLHNSGSRSEPCGNRRSTGSTTAVRGIQGRWWMGHQFKETRNTQGSLRSSSSSRLQRLSFSSSPSPSGVHTKLDSDVTRLLRLPLRGGGGGYHHNHHRAEGLLTGRFFSNRNSNSRSSSSDESRRYMEKRNFEDEVRRQLRTLSCQRNHRAEQQQQQLPNQMLAEEKEEGVSQSSGGTSGEWVNLEDDDLQDEDEDQCLLEKEAVSQDDDARERVSSNFEWLANPNSSSSSSNAAAGGLGKAPAAATTATFPAAAALLSAAAPAPRTVGGGGLVSSVASYSGSVGNDGKKSSSTHESGSSSSSMSSNPHPRHLKASEEPNGVVTFGRMEETKTAGTSSTCGGCVYDDCTLSSVHQPHSNTVDEDVHEDTKATAKGCDERVRLPRQQDSPSSGSNSSSSVFWSRMGWETLDTEVAFPSTLQAQEHDGAQGVREFLQNEPHGARKHAFSSLWPRALRRHEVVLRDGADVPAHGRSAATEDSQEVKEKQDRGDTEGAADQLKFEAPKERSSRGTAGKTHQEEEASSGASNGDKSNSFLTRDDGTCSEEEGSSVIMCSSESRITQPTYMPLSRLFGTAAGEWNLLNVGSWKKHEDKSEKKEEDTICKDARDEERIQDSKKSPSPAFSSSRRPETHGKHNTLRGSSSRDKRILVKRCGKGSSSVCRRQSKRRRRSNSNRSIRIRGRVIISKDSPGGGGGDGSSRHEEVGRRVDGRRSRSSSSSSSSIIDRDRSSSPGPPPQRLCCSNNNIPACSSSSSIGWGGNHNGTSSSSRYRRSSPNSSTFHSTTDSVYRSVSCRRSRHQNAYGSSYARNSSNNNKGEGEDDTAVVGTINEGAVNLHATLLHRRPIICTTADILRARWLETNVTPTTTLGESLQPRTVAAGRRHPLPAPSSSHSCRTRYRPADRGTAAAGVIRYHRRRGTAPKRPTRKVTINNVPLRESSFCNGLRRGGRALKKHLEKELGCYYKERSSRREGRRQHVAEQAARHMLLRVRSLDNYARTTLSPRRASLNESRRNKCIIRMASLGSQSSIRMNGSSTSARSDGSSKSSNDANGNLHERPPWSFRPSTALGKGLTFKKKSQRWRAFPGSSPFTCAASSRLYDTGTFSTASSTDLFSSAAPFPFCTNVTTPLSATARAWTGNLKSSVYVTGVTASCPPPLPASPIGAAHPAAGVLHTQSSSALAGGVPNTALLFTGKSFRGCASTTANAHTDTESCVTAASTSPFWCRWPAAALRVVGLPLRCVVQVLGLNVSGAFDRWREEIRQRSLRGFLTLCLLDGVVCAAAVWGVCHVAVFASRVAFRAAYLHVHSIDTERASHYFDGLTYRFWGKRPLYFTDNPLLGAGRAADAEIATDPWSGLYQLQQRGIAWYQHHMYGDL